MIAILPRGARPSKATSTDKTRPVLTHADLVEAGGRWLLVATNSYILSVLPLEIRDIDNAHAPALVGGRIDRAALVAIEKAGSFSADAETVGLCTVDKYDQAKPTGVTMPRGHCDATFPRSDQLQPCGDPIATIGLNGRHLIDLLTAQGLAGRDSTVVLTIRDPLKAVSVSAPGEDACALIMPIRLPEGDPKSHV